MKKLFFAIIVLVSANVAAQKSVDEIKGDKYYSQYFFTKAAENYSKSASLGIESKRKLANSLYYSGKLEESELIYSDVAKAENATADDYFSYSYILRLNGKYQESEHWLEKFSKAKPTDLRAKSFSANKPKFATYLKDEGRFTINLLDINTPEQEFGPSYYMGNLVFAATREGSAAVKRTYSWNQKSFLDLYTAANKDGKLQSVVPFNKKINDKMHEGPASFTPDGETMAFTRNNYNNKSADGTIKLEIFFLTKDKKGNWTNETAFKLNNSEYSVGHPYILADGNTMYFASDMPGGLGGTDIYRIKKQNGAWGDPENLGSAINTEGDEMFPFFNEEKKLLVFASNGQLGLGGLDLFLAPESKSGNFQTALNMGFPLNTQYDDFALIAEPNFKKGYFSSNRPGGKGDDDIYAFDLLKPFPTSKILTGVTEDQKRVVLPNAMVVLKNSKGVPVDSVKADKDGFFTFEVEEGNYSIDASLDKYLPAEKKVTILPEDQEKKTTLVLKQNPGISLVAIITEAASKKPIDGVTLKFFEKPTSKEFSGSTNSAGTFREPLAEKVPGDKLAYIITIEKQGYLKKEVEFQFTPVKPGEILLHEMLDLSFHKIEVGADLAKMIDIKPIYFDLGKYNIRKDAAVELEKIVKIMNEYPEMIVELGSHTDCRGTAASNEKLSDQRAISSADYIKTRISNPGRISGKGFGESRLLNDCACEGVVKSTCSEPEHQQNRRTEFIILSF
jgi:outer membrane protein OmpA-like peptidoglycan-associated protein